MTTFARSRTIDPMWFRFLGRASAIMLASAWLVLVLAEAIRSEFAAPSPNSLYQGIALGVVFAGYVIGWRNELSGGVLAIVGILVFLAVHVITLQTLPAPAVLCFALPGVFYLLSHYLHRTHGPVSQP